MREVIRASAYNGFVDLVHELGGDLQEIASKAGARLPTFERPDDFVPSRDLYLLVAAAAECTRRPDLGLLWGETTDLSILGPLHIAMSNSDTARDAIDLAAAFVHMHSPLAEVSRTPLPDQANELITLRSRMLRPPPLMQILERSAVLLHRTLTMICDEDYQPVEVWFPHARLSPIHTYRKIFGVDPEFERPQCAVVVDRCTLAAHRPGRSHQLLDMAESYLRREFSAPGSVIGKDVTNMIRILIETHDCTAAQVAKVLGLHERTMQRRLQTAGESFEKLKDAVVREMAVSMLQDPDMQISQIAWKLHYANSSAFTRACQRWFGLSPRDLRQRLIRDHSPKDLATS